MRALDLGCGQGMSTSWVVKWAADCDEIYGIDVDTSALKEAAMRYPSAIFVHASAEAMPFPDSYFDRINASVSLPYMDIPKAIGEIRRVLKPEGHVRFSLHGFSFEFHAWRRASLASALVYHPYVIANGLLLHFGLPLFRFPLNRSRLESFQTERGIKRLLVRNRFQDIAVSIDGRRFIITARGQAIHRFLSPLGITPLETVDGN